MGKISIKKVGIGSLLIFGIGILGYGYFEGSSIIGSNKSYQRRIDGLEKSIERYNVELQNRNPDEELSVAADAYAELVQNVSVIAASQETLLNNQNNGLVYTEQRVILKKLISDFTDRTDLLFVSIDVSDVIYSVKYSIAAVYDANSISIPVVFSYYANDQLIYTVKGWYLVADKKVSISNVYATKNTFKYNRKNDFGEQSDVYNESDYIETTVVDQHGGVRNE